MHQARVRKGKVNSIVVWSPIPFDSIVDDMDGYNLGMFVPYTHEELPICNIFTISS